MSKSRILPCDNAQICQYILWIMQGKKLPKTIFVQNSSVNYNYKTLL